MILRHLTQNIKAQNWFAVILELVIVSAGVLIGIQAANWNTERMAAKEEAALLVQMHEAFVEDVNATIAGRTYNNEAIEAIEYILRAIRDGAEPENREVFLDALLKSRGVRSYIYEAPIATVLISSGGLTDLSSPDLRQAIANYRNLVTVMQQAGLAQQALLENIANGVENGVYLNPDSSSRSDLIYDYDFEQVAANREFYQRLLMSSQTLGGMSDNLIAVIETIIEEIEDAQK